MGETTKLFTVLACAAVLLSPQKSMAGSMQEGQLGLALWRCSALGSLARIDHEKSDEQFDQGYVLVTGFVQSLDEGAFSFAELEDANVPYHWSLSGANHPEFRMGKTWSLIEELAFNEAMPDEDGLSSDEVFDRQKEAAVGLYQDANCDVLGSI